MIKLLKLFLGNLITTLKRRIFWLYKLSVSDLGKSMTIEFPVIREGAGILTVGDRFYLGRLSNLGIGKDANLTVLNDAHIATKSVILIKNNRIVINHNILIEHLSLGSLNADWLKYSRVFYNKWKQFLPIALKSNTSQDVKKCTYKSYYSYVFNNYRLKTKSVFVVLFIVQMICLRPFDRKTFSAIKYFFK